MNSNGMTIYKAAAALTKTEREDFWAQAKALIASRLFPDKLKTAEEAFMVALYGHELGLSPQRAWKQIHIIKGVPGPEVHLQVAMVRQAIPSLIWKIVHHDEKACVIRHGRTADDVQDTSFTYQEAVDAQLSGKDNWKKDRRAMLYARAAGRAVRWFYPETQGGGLLHNAEELQDGARPSQEERMQEATQGEGRMPKKNPLTQAPAAEPAPGPGPAPVVVDAPAQDMGEEAEWDPTKPKPTLGALVDTDSKGQTRPGWDKNAPEPDKEVLRRASAQEVIDADPVDEDSVLSLVEEMGRSEEINEIEKRYDAWRQKHRDDPATLIKGYDAKEARIRAVNQ